MKRASDSAAEDVEGSERSMKPKHDVNESPSRGTQQETIWWFVTCGEDGASYYIHRWDPSTAKDPTAVKAALLAARGRCLETNTVQKPSLYFYRVIKWITGGAAGKDDDDDHVEEVPVEFLSLNRDDIGVFAPICQSGDPGEIMHDGRILFYSSWS